ncbi:hypothetical protein L7F22_054525 [Adiantum nelumboides]|nr:hypothetical protein [Adiantum nelumboides]
MRQPSNSLSLKLHNLKTPNVRNQSQAQIIAANFTRCRSGKEGLLTTIRSTQAPVLSAKAGPTTALNVSSKRRKKAVKRKLNKYLSGELAACSKAPKKSTVRAQYASPSCKKFQQKQVEQESKFIKKHSKRQSKGETFTEDDTCRIKKRVKYLLNRMNKEQNLIDAYSAEGWKGQSREKLRPESELQKAKAQILRFHHGIREAMHELDLLGLEGTMKEYLFDSRGQIYHEDIFCAICKRQDVVVNNDIILCDGACDRAFHQLCLRPPLRTDEMPSKDYGESSPRFPGQLHTCPDEILEMASVYYETLFTSDPLTRDVLDARDEEMTDAVHGLDGASCPGDAGLSCQFFMQYWDLISQPLQEGLQEIFDTRCMSPSMSSGIIPKGGDAFTLRQWRPITLMSSVYKILARMITARLRPFLLDLIHSSQTRFVQDRSMLDNVVTFYEAVECARRSSLL